MKPIEIFKAGTHRAMSGAMVTITKADLAACAASYDRALCEAPFVVGHPKTDAPAYAWTAGLELQGDTLVATPTQVETAFAQMVEEGRFKKRSAAFYGPSDPHNPTPGKYYLRHVGFLGAAGPVVHGLKDVAFSGGAGSIEFADWQGLAIARLFGNVREFLIAQFGQDKADAVLPSESIDQLRFEAAQPVPDPTESAGLAPMFTQGDNVTTEAERAALAAAQAQLAQERLEFAQREKAARISHITTFVDSIVAAGKLATGHKAGMIAFMAAIPTGDDGAFEFAQADGQTVKTDAMAWFQGFLKELKPLVITGQVAPHRPGQEFAQGQPPVLAPAAIYKKFNERA